MNLSLEYDDIRQEFVNFLQKDPYYKDFNFEASNISRLLNILAYANTYNGYYTKMLLDESMPDSAKTRTSLIGHANSRNYVVKFITSSKALVRIEIDGNKVNDKIRYIHIPNGTSFKGFDRENKTVYFINPYDVTLYHDEKDNKFKSDEFLIIQGVQKKVTYEVKELNKKYIINDVEADPDTIQVKIKTNKDTNISVEYIRNNSFYDTEPLKLCHYLSANTQGTYQVHFGRDLYGREPKIGEYVEISYIKTAGSIANDANKFTIITSKKKDTEEKDINYYVFSDVKVITIDSSSGGMDKESIDELRFAVINHSRQRGRVVTAEDIKSVIISEFRDVESINVWSGGTASYRRYGKTYISIKPKTGDVLTNTAKRIISDTLVNKYGVVSRTDLIFVDPTFIDVRLKLKFKINRDISSDNSSTVKARLEDLTYQYNKEKLSKFDSHFYDSDYIAYLKNNDVALLTVYTEKQLQYTLKTNYTTGEFDINFGNMTKLVKSNVFQYGKLNVLIYNKDSDMYIYDIDNNIDIAKIGTLDIESGKIKITVPDMLKIESIIFTAEPAYTDIQTDENNIVRIKSIESMEV